MINIHFKIILIPLHSIKQYYIYKIFSIQDNKQSKESQFVLSQSQFHQNSKSISFYQCYYNFNILIKFSRNKITFFRNQINSSFAKESMSQQQKLNTDLQSFQKTIGQKIYILRQILQQDDKSVVQQILIKNSPNQTYLQYDKKTSYYRQFWKVFLFNEILISKIKNYSVTNKEATNQIVLLEGAQKEWSQLWIKKQRKKIRRTSEMINKIYKCPFINCSKPYGSDVSLNLHLKIKHNCGTKTQRQALAKEICLSQEKGYNVEITLLFPPGYMEEFRKKFKVECLSNQL